MEGRFVYVRNNSENTHIKKKKNVYYCYTPQLEYGIYIKTLLLFLLDSVRWQGTPLKSQIVIYRKISLCRYYWPNSKRLNVTLSSRLSWYFLVDLNKHWYFIIVSNPVNRYPKRVVKSRPRSLKEQITVPVNMCQCLFLFILKIFKSLVF